MAKHKVNTSNVSNIGPGSLIAAFDKIDKLDASKLTVESLELQFVITRELEQRGWELDDDEGWTFYLSNHQ